MTNDERDQLLIRLDERTKRFEKQMDNHLQHHFRYNFFAWTAVIGLIITLIIQLLN